VLRAEKARAEDAAVPRESHTSPAGRVCVLGGTAFCKLGRIHPVPEVRSLGPHGIPVAGAKFGDLRTQPHPRSTFLPSRRTNHSANCHWHLTALSGRGLRR